MLYILGYVLAINLVGFAIMGIDKWKAKRHMWRISERDIFIFAALGGSVGIIMGMKTFRHKTLHNKFRYGIPFMLLTNAAFIGYISYVVLKAQ